MALQKVDVHNLKENPFTLIGKDWMLITAGTPARFNTMTASWGAVGVMWGKPVATCYIRQTRYTKSFVEDSGYYTLTFLKDGYREVLSRLGAKSGREIDKIGDSGLTPLALEGQPAFAEAKLVLVCRKQFKGEIAPEGFLDRAPLEKWYADQNYHTMYMGEIAACYQDA